MTELQIGELLLDLALLFVLTYLLAALLERRRIPGILAALFVAYAKEYAVDPIVLGRRQRSTIEHIHVGSTTNAMISLATGPVLIVPIGFSENVS